MRSAINRKHGNTAGHQPILILEVTMSAVARWLTSGMPGLDYVIVGYWVVGAFLGLYLGICALMERNPANFEEVLTDKMQDLKKAIWLRIVLAVVALVNLFIPGASLFVGIGGHLFLLTKVDNASSYQITSLIFGGMLLMGIIGALVISSGIIPLEA